MANQFVMNRRAGKPFREPPEDNNFASLKSARITSNVSNIYPYYCYLQSPDGTRYYPNPRSTTNVSALDMTIPDNIIPGKWTFYIYLRSGTNQPFAVIINGITVSRRRRITTSNYYYFNIGGTQAAATSVEPGPPRYLVKSPSEGGYTIESVRELSAREVARLRNQGFTVTHTTAAPSEPIRTRTGAAMRRAPALTGARQRRGIATAPMPRRRRVRLTMPEIRHKSAPRRVFMEPRHDDWVIMQKVVNGRLTIAIIRGSQTYRWVSSGYRQVTRYPDNAAGQRSTWTFATNLNPTTRVIWGTSSRPANRGSGGGGRQTPPTLSPTETAPAPSGTSAQLSELQSRLATIDRNLVKLGQDASALGTSTGQRAQEIAQLRADYQKDAQDLHKKVGDLGKSGTDASAAIASLASQVAALDAKVAAAAGTSAGASVGGFNFSSLTNLLPMVVIVMIIAMIAKVGR